VKRSNDVLAMERRVVSGGGLSAKGPGWIVVKGSGDLHEMIVDGGGSPAQRDFKTSKRRHF